MVVVKRRCWDSSKAEFTDHKIIESMVDRLLWFWEGFEFFEALDMLSVFYYWRSRDRVEIIDWDVFNFFFKVDKKSVPSIWLDYIKIELFGVFESIGNSSFSLGEVIFEPLIV